MFSSVPQELNHNFRRNVLNVNIKIVIGLKKLFNWPFMLFSENKIWIPDAPIKSKMPKKLLIWKSLKFCRIHKKWSALPLDQTFSKSSSPRLFWRCLSNNEQTVSQTNRHSIVSKKWIFFFNLEGFYGNIARIVNAVQSHSWTWSWF